MTFHASKFEVPTFSVGACSHHFTKKLISAETPTNLLYDQVQDHIRIRQENFDKYGQNHEINLGIKMIFAEKVFTP